MFTPNFQFFGFDPKGACADRRSSVEDVEYTEVKDSSDNSRTQSAPEYDKAARAAQINEAAKAFGKRMEVTDPLLGIMLVGYFTEGAEWSDDLPQSDKASESSFIVALARKLDKMEKNSEEWSEKTGRTLSSTASLVVLSTVAAGAQWAFGNPPVKKAQPEIDRNFREWVGTVFSSPVDFHVDDYGRIHVTTNQKIFAAVQRGNAKSLLSLAEDIIVNEHGILVIIISEENSKPLIKNSK